jgi:transcriptional regulator with XRE-family HTH domain
MSRIDDLIAVRALARAGTARSLRLEGVLSLREVADVVGVDPSTIHRWEDGESTPRMAHALRWLDLLRDIERALASVGGDPEVVGDAA